MKNLSFFVFIGIIFFTSHDIYSAQLSADDFLPPVQLESGKAQQAAKEIKQPDKITNTKGFDNQDALEGATAQDAINAAVKKFDAEPGCQQVKFPSGFGWVSTGIGSYGVLPNPVATLMAQRQAYQVAYMGAKKNLAQALYGLSTEGRDNLKDQIKTVISNTDTLSNLSDSFSENIEEQVQGLLRGYVVYSVDDNQSGNYGTVTVTIVATPKTMGKGQRLDLNSLSADTIKDGLTAVLAELQNGLTPPVGGRVISVPETGEIAFIGFGSAIVPTNPNPAAQVKLNVTAQKMAQIRARSALCGIIIGEEVSGTSSLDAQTKSMSKQFQEIQKEDPMGQNVNQTEIAKLNNQRNSFLSTQMSSEEISSLRRGVLPPGVSIKTFFNPEKTMAEAVAVYLPSASANAASFGEQMKNAKIMRDPSNPDAINDLGSSEKQGSMPPRGASGQVTNDEDL